MIKKLIAICLIAGALDASSAVWISEVERRNLALQWLEEAPPLEEAADPFGEYAADVMSIKARPVPKPKPVPKPEPKPQPKPKPAPKPKPNPAPIQPPSAPNPPTKPPVTRPS
ncbi:MAG: hypothetical protein JWL90_1025 [Chthoniobacteraceae bacterium]|nr:hypothetical protein [Chthoniobacteraceae bacterium]